MLITLTILALVTILVLAFLGLASQDLKSTNFYVHSQQADQIARGGLDFVVGNLQGEIADSGLSANSGAGQTNFYVPLNSANTFPVRMVPVGAASTNILLTSASGTFYTGGAASSTMASTISSTNISLNNQVITAGDWNKPMLVPSASAAGIPIPNWIFVSRTGPTTTSLTPASASSLVSPSLGNPNAVIGRYAFIVYDTSGLLDINVAGYDAAQASMAAGAPGKGLLPWADLTQLPGVASADVANLVAFRNPVSETNYPLALTNGNGFGLQSNGFMQVYAASTNGPSDSAFLSRQELIKYATSVDTGWSNALPYVTTFSRELNGPTWGPTANLGTINGTNYNYQTSAGSTSTNNYNPNLYTVKVLSIFTRNNGIPAVVGEPLVKYRFPLDKLALLESVGTKYSYSDWTANKDNIQTNIQKYFGLDLVSDSNGLYRHWTYPTSSRTGNSTSTILSLASVAALATPRDPDFFELLQAGMLSGSLGAYGRAQNGGVTVGPSVTTEDMDGIKTLQVLRIGANIIDQWDADSYPTTIGFIVDSTGDTWNVYGTEDLPAITQMFTKAYYPNNFTMPIYPYIYFQIWNPHQAPSSATYNSANYPSKFRIVPYHAPASNVGISDYYWFKLIYNNGGNYRWPYNADTGTWGSPGVPANASYFYKLAPSFGGGDEALNGPTDPAQGLNFTFNPLSNYREPGLVVGSPTAVDNSEPGFPAGHPWTPAAPPYGGSPSSGNLAVISMPEIEAFPTDGTFSSQTPGSGYTNIYWNAATMAPLYTINYITQTVWVVQYQDPSGYWRTYSTFIGLDTQAPLGGSYSYGTGWNLSGSQHPSTNNACGDVSWAKADPRTFRLGMSENNQVAVATGFGGKYSVVTNVFLNASNPLLLTPTSVAWNINSIPSVTPNASALASVPFRLDYWTANSTNNAAIPLASNPYMTDPDGAVRGGDSTYAYSASTTAWGSIPVLPGASYPSAALPARPAMLNHPFHSVGDLGYAYRDNPWRTLDFMTPSSGDAGLLDIFSMSEAPVLAGRINPNTPYARIVQTLINGATQSSYANAAATTIVPVATAQAVGQSLVAISAATPITNRASMVTSGAVSNVINGGAFTDNGQTSLVKTEGESLVRAMAESSNTRTWNFLIDVIGQSGHFIKNSAPVSSGGQDNFVVEGERRYWLHVAIDRYTGQIVDQQIELVDQ